MSANAHTVVASFPPTIGANPYQRLLYRHLAAFSIIVYDGNTDFTALWLWRARRHVQALHFHWPQGYYRCQRAPRRVRAVASWAKLGAFVVRLTSARALGYRIVWTVHQVYPHERKKGLDHLAALALSRASDALIAHDRSTASEALSALRCSRLKVHVIPHGTYVGVYPRGRSRSAVRSELGIAETAFVFLSFGNIRAYKDLDVLLDAFSRVALTDAVLIIAGAVMDDEAAAIVRRKAAVDRRIRPLLLFVPDEGVAELFGASDAAVVARGDGGTSGSLILAMSLGLPPIAADTPAYDELLDGGEAGWLFRPADSESLRHVLETVAGNPTVAKTKGKGALVRAKDRDWPSIGLRTAQAILGAEARDGPNPAPASHHSLVSEVPPSKTHRDRG